NEERFSLHLFIPKANPRLMWEVGWNDEVWSGKREGSTGHRPVPPGDPPGGTSQVNPPANTLGEQVRPSVPVGGSPTGTGGRPGFKAEIVAAEPLLQDPIAFDWSADGRLWVVDMFDYPLGRVEPSAGAAAPTRAPRGEEILSPPEGGRYMPGGRIKVLEDTDG